MDSETIDKVATTVVIAGAAFVASKLFEIGWKAATRRPVPAEGLPRCLRGHVGGHRRRRPALRLQGHAEVADS